MIKLRVLCFCTSLIAFTGIVRCKPDYLYNQEAEGWLKLHRIPAPWHEAFLRCHYEGAVLASPLNAQLTNVLHKIVTEYTENHKFFLGIHDLHSKGDFFSVEGVPLADMYIRWGEHGIGADMDGSCFAMLAGGFADADYMHLSSCTDRLPYICYKKQGNETTLEPCGTFDKRYVLNQRTGSCYKLHVDKQTWSRAHMICAAEGGHLVILNDEEEANIVREMFPAQGSMIDVWEHMFIGLRAWDDDRAWMTIHGESLENMFKSWAPHQPDNYQGKQHCGTLMRVGTLDDRSCEGAAMFVCEKDPETSRFERVPQILQNNN